GSLLSIGRGSRGTKRKLGKIAVPGCSCVFLYPGADSNSCSPRNHTLPTSTVNPSSPAGIDPLPAANADPGAVFSVPGSATVRRLDAVEQPRRHAACKMRAMVQVRG